MPNPASSRIRPGSCAGGVRYRSGDRDSKPVFISEDVHEVFVNIFMKIFDKEVLRKSISVLRYKRISREKDIHEDSFVLNFCIKFCR